MKKNVKLLKLTLWWGVAADLFEAFRMVFPNLYINTTGANFVLNNELRYALLYGMPVMVGWAIILFWAVHKPLERKSVLLCLIPVIVLYMIIGVIATANCIYPIGKMVPTFIMQTALLILSILSYLKNKD